MTSPTFIPIVLLGGWIIAFIVSIVGGGVAIWRAHRKAEAEYLRFRQIPVSEPEDWELDRGAFHHRKGPAP